MTFAINGTTVIGGSGEFIVLSSATRPTTPSTGTLFFNSSTGIFEIYNGVGWQSASVDTVVKNVWAWGLGTFGRIGDGTTTDRSSPVSVTGQVTDWVQISTGSQHTVAIRADGTAWSWGAGTNGRLGNTTNTSSLSPSAIDGGFTDWVQISAGLYNGVGVRSNGTAWSWGLGTDGNLGDLSLTTKSSPVSVAGFITDWVQVSTMFRHTSAIRADGTAWGWGLGTSGQLGNNLATGTSSPVQVVGGFTDWFQISAGWLHTSAIRANGTAWSWGSNANGRLGDNTTTNRSSPVSVVGGFTDWVQISAGYTHTAAVRANGTAWAWGSNSSGQLGDNTILSRSSPVQVVGGFTDWIQIDADDHSSAIRANGTAWCWGTNSNGRLGDNTTTNRSSPVSVVGGFTDWVQISAGGATTGIRAT